MRVKDIGEFALIDLLAEILASQDPAPIGRADEGGFRLQVPVGDDAAAWSGPAGTTVLTTDTLVEGVHFDLGRTSWRDLGWKSMAVNLSDIAAMGCAPMYSVVTLGLHGDVPVDGLADMYHGLLEACRHYGGVVVGGDVVRSAGLFVSVAMTGAAGPGEAPVLTRGAATPGDRVAVTGSLGASAGGLRMLLGELALDEGVASRLRHAHNRPAPRVREGIILRSQGVLAAIDVSDGLVDDLGKLCQASKVGARIHAERVPVDGFLKAAYPREWRDLALSGGEDYELLFTVPPPVMDAVTAALDIPIAVIGEIATQAEGVTVLDYKGDPIVVERGGWDHFR